jgi:hypothetical protein
MIPHTSSRRRESGLVDDFALQLLRCAQHDSQGICYVERSEASLVDLWGITRSDPLVHFAPKWYMVFIQNTRGLSSSDKVEA